jgi:transcriptional regulator with XRE-family HTH domain
VPRTDRPDCVFWRHVGHRYRVARLALGLTEQEAAAAAGVTVKTWRKWENQGPGRAGHLGPLDFAARFDVSIGWLFCGEGESIGSHLAKHANGVIAILPRGKGRPLPKAVLRKRGRTARAAQTKARANQRDRAPMGWTPRQTTAK